MKLARIEKPLRSVQVRVTLGGDLNAALESYARYYEHVHGQSVDPKTLVPEILHAFLDADREFQVWRRSRDIASHVHGSAVTSPNGSAKAQA
jgi:hypothetical protein